MAVQRFRLTVVDRTIIEVWRRHCASIRMIARELGRSSGTVCDNIKRHGKFVGYRAAAAEADAAASRRHIGFSGLFCQAVGFRRNRKAHAAESMENQYNKA